MSSDVIATQSDLRDCCDEWQKRLRLQDWRVAIRFGEVQDFTSTQAANIEWNDNKKSALINIRPAALHSGNRVLEPIEQSIIHELCHLLLHWIPDESRSPLAKILEENAVESMAWALYSTKYPDQRDAWKEEMEKR